MDGFYATRVGLRALCAAQAAAFASITHPPIHLVCCLYIYPSSVAEAPNLSVESPGGMGRGRKSHALSVSHPSISAPSDIKSFPLSSYIMPAREVCTAFRLTKSYHTGGLHKGHSNCVSRGRRLPLRLTISKIKSARNTFASF